MSVVDSKINEFGALADKSDDDHTAIGHLNTIKGHLSDVSGLLNARKRSRRSVESKKNISCFLLVTKKFLNRLYQMDQFENQVSGHPVQTRCY